ncbi:MAG: hypothetical protein V1857_05240 [archaeon]
MNIADLVGPLIAAAFTLMVYSFLYKENKAYRLAEHIFIGVAIAHGVVNSSKYVWDRALTPLLTKGDFIWALPILVGMLFCFFFSKKNFWLYRIPVSMVVGMGTGLAMAGLMRSQFTDQIIQTITIPNPNAAWYSGSTPINTVLIAIGAIGTLFFFIFTKEQKGALLYASYIGRYTMMVAFGAAFGFTVMARISLLIGRLQFLLDPTTPVWYLIPIAIVAIIAAVALQRKEPAKS